MMHEVEIRHMRVRVLVRVALDSKRRSSAFRCRYLGAAFVIGLRLAIISLYGEAVVDLRSSVHLGT